MFFAGIHETFGKKLKVVKDRVLQHENRFTEAETQIADVKRALGSLKVGDGAAATVTATSMVRRFAV